MVVDRHKLTVFYLKSFDMDSVQVGKAVFGKRIALPWESNLGPTPIRGDMATPSVCWVKKNSTLWNLAEIVKSGQFDLEGPEFISMN